VKVGVTDGESLGLDVGKPVGCSDGILVGRDVGGLVGLGVIAELD